MANVVENEMEVSDTNVSQLRIEMEIEIARPKLEEAPQIIDFFDNVLEDTFRRNDILDLVDTFEGEKSAKRRCLLEDFESAGLNRYFLIAKLAGKVVGTIEFGPSNDLIAQCTHGELEHILEIGTVFVHPSFQSKGIGNQLLKAIGRGLKEREATEFCLDSGYQSAQKVWQHKFGVPTYHMKDFWGPGADHMIWRVRVDEIVQEEHTIQLIQESNDFSDYLKCTEIIDWQQSEILQVAQQLQDKYPNELDLVEATYEFVRDEISHSADIHGRVVTCKSSEVLKEHEGICYAKSHLLAGILRAMDIPTGFCYQKLMLSDEEQYLILHGLNGVYLQSLKKWIRLDARGNKAGVDAQFRVDEEKLAFPVNALLGEEEDPTIYTDPDENVLKALQTYDSVELLFSNLPRNLAK